MTIKVLRDMEIDEISLVDRPANSHAKVIISKRDSEEDMSVDYVYTDEGEVVDVEDLEPGEVVYDEDGDAFLVVDEDDEDYEEEEIGKKAAAVRGPASDLATGLGIRAKEARAAISRRYRTPASESESINLGAGSQRGKVVRVDPKGNSSETRYLSGPKSKKPETTITERAAKMRWGNVGRDAAVGAAGVGAVGAAGGGAYYAKKKIKKSFSDELREEISKAVTESERDEVIAKAFEQMEEMAEYVAETEEIAKSERELRLISEYEEVAKSYGLPVPDEDLAVVLYTIAETLPYEHQEIIHKALSAAGEAIFMEYGTEGYGTNSDVLAAVDGFIDDNVSKSDISKAEAVAAVFEANPEAYEAYLAERNYR